ncbi:MAG: DUF4142 domain-containing protein [Rhodospirillaceae bacterium]|nr:DUF4142 domain-containing protein [Rhodospirillales bacterium]
MKAALVICALLVPAVGAAQSMTAEDFIRQAVEDNLADVEAGRMAEGTGTLPLSVQQLGRQISSSSMRMNEELSRLAASRGIVPANQIRASDRHTLERLSKLQSGTFTREYLRSVLADLEHDRALFQIATALEDPGVAQFARNTLPEIEKQLQVAGAVYDAQVGSMAER